MFVAPRYRRPVSIIVALTFITTTSGCTGIPGIGGSANLTVDPGDPCGPQRAAFAQSNEFFTADVLKTVGFATLAGAGAGAGIGAIAGGGRGALTGALIGGGLALGGSLLYSYSQYLQEHTTNTGEFASKVDQDMRRESTQIDKTSYDFAQLRTCRFANAALIRRQYNYRQISREQAMGELAQERTWFAQELAQAQQWGVNMQKRDQQFEQATNLLEQKAPPRTSRPAVVTATETLPDKRQSFQSLGGSGAGAVPGRVQSRHKQPEPIAAGIDEPRSCLGLPCATPA